MYRRIERPLTGAEVRWVRGAIAREDRARPRLFTEARWGAAAAVAAGLWLWLWWVLPGKWSGPLRGWSGARFYAGAVLLLAPSIWWAALRAHARRLRGLHSALESRRAVEHQVAASAVAEIEGPHGEDFAWAFQAESDRILLWPCHWPLPARFPTAEVALIEALGEDGAPRLGRVRARGQRLAPVRTVAARLLPERVEVVSGRLEELEDLLPRE